MFGLAVGFVFFGRPEVAFLIALGALLPDLDREYWFMRTKIYSDEQIHRAGLHNVFVMAITYLVSPFLSLGVFLHVLQDSFTTVKDRGVEWFYPITRLVKRGMYDSQGNPQPSDPKKHIYFYQEDPKGLVEHADPDLQEPGPVPWRRVYGFAQNSHLLDRGFLFGSAAIILIWSMAPLDLSHYLTAQGYLYGHPLQLGIQYGWVALTFLAGELDRKDRTDAPRLGKFNFIKYPLLALGLLGLGGWLYTILDQVDSNLAVIVSNPIQLILSCVVTPIVGAAVILWQTRKGKTTMV
jgi:hypothetical protein